MIIHKCVDVDTNSEYSVSIIYGKSYQLSEANGDKVLLSEAINFCPWCGAKINDDAIASARIQEKQVCVDNAVKELNKIKKEYGRE